MTGGRIAVGLSGGVDSAVAAAMLRDAGEAVVGVSMRIWDGGAAGAPSARHACYGPGEDEDLHDAERIAAHLGIPFHAIDLTGEYRREILDACAAQYLAGRTPNPCVHCNRRLKFDLLPARLRALGIEVEAFATGHYAITGRDPASGRALLRRGVDRAKDQSYFLYQLTQEQLGQARFPLGPFTKAEVRARARALALPVAEKAESQDFIAGGYDAIFRGPDAPGPILDGTGREIGRHAGIRHFTIGQRRGLGIASREPLYVVALDAVRGAVVIGPAENLYAATLEAEALHWIAIPSLDVPRRMEARIRYRHEAAPATVAPLPGGRARVVFDEPQRAIAPGQAVVFYEGDLVVGGGIIAGPET
jgi:tRNA-uridine 2-sulfurtransferase